MKILHINTNEWGGAAIAAIRLHKALLNSGIDSSILFLNRSDLKTEHGISFLYKAKTILMRILYKYKLLPTRENRFKKLLKWKYDNSSEIYSYAWTDYDITQHIAYKRADIIHLHWVTGFVDYESFFMKNNKPVIWTLHDQNPFTAICHYSQGCSQFQNQCVKCPIVNHKSIIKSYISKVKAIKRVDNLTIISPSNWLFELSKKSNLLNRFSHFRVSNGLDLSVFKPYEKQLAREVFQIPMDKKIFLFVCDNLENTRKGFSILLNAITQLNRTSLGFYALGFSQNKYEHINLLGNIKEEKLLALLYSAADAFILPSLSDNLPNTMLESIACGTPVIAFPIGGIPDAVKHAFTGVLCDSLTSESLKKAIIEFDEGKYPFDRTAIRQFAVDNFSDKKQAMKYREFYKQVITRNVLP
jgi:glycosyltransferase involved in cell wall biosynthesis